MDNLSVRDVRNLLVKQNAFLVSLWYITGE